MQARLTERVASVRERAQAVAVFRLRAAGHSPCGPRALPIRATGWAAFDGTMSSHPTMWTRDR